MSETRKSGVGSRGSELGSPTNSEAPTPDTRLPTPREPNWRLIYSAVIVELVILIVIFYAFTKAFA
jgi:hypothetical protein